MTDHPGDDSTADGPDDAAAIGDEGPDEPPEIGERHARSGEE